MAIPRIETPHGRSAFSDFAGFYDQVYESRDVRWRGSTRLEIAVVAGESPFNQDRVVRPFMARVDGNIVARVLAVMDSRYNRHWHDQLGHLCWFEALPNTREAVQLLLDEACSWLKSQGAIAARIGHGMLEFPFAIDAYDLLPPNALRQSPAYYHALLKEAGCETEKGFVDYKVALRPELITRWAGMLEATRRGGYDIVPLRDLPEDRRVREFTATFNETFSAHWGWTPYSEAELAALLHAMTRVGILDTSVIAYRGDEPVGMLLVVPEHSGDAVLKPGRVLRDAERLNILAIGVREPARGRGVNLAMSSYGFLELVRRGATHLSYTLVLDDNWPSRRTAEKLGAFVCANYVAYRRNFR
jgi:GNAT superfamily N-acetyltransferase